MASHGACRVWAEGRHSCPGAGQSLGSDTRRAQGGVHVGAVRQACPTSCAVTKAPICVDACLHVQDVLCPGGLRSAPGRWCWAPGSCLCPLLGRESGVGRGRLLLPVLLPALQHRRGRRVHVQHEALPARHLAVPQKVLSAVGHWVRCPWCGRHGPWRLEGFRKGVGSVGGALAARHQACPCCAKGAQPGGQSQPPRP